MVDLAEQFGENTIDEPVSETILRDLRLVSRSVAMYPPSSTFVFQTAN